MRLLKPAWVTHGDDKPIFSIDIHPDGSRFATGGQGDSSGKVVVWNMAPVREEKYEQDENVPKLLCQMENHLSCVNCVRWSNNGKYLASGGDDKIIIIWQSSRSGASSVFGSAGKVMNFEQWRAVNTLRGHSGDVLDLAWSPHDAWFASCSVDNTIVVWNALKFPEQISVIRGHSGLVKGVTWDPVGKYLASQSDDKTLKVWRTLDWQQETSVSEPFQECGGTTHVLRLNWSPDGQYVVSAHAMNNAGPTAQIVERDGWKTNMDFVGHRKAVTAVRFNPRILAKKLKKNSERAQQYSCCAIGSRDRSLSIWLTALKRPLVVTHELFQSSVLDISWSLVELELLCCSWDGTVAYMGFDETELGRPLSVDEKHRLHKKIYGKSLMTSGMNGNLGNQIVETAAMLDIQQKKEEKKQKEKELMSRMKTPETSLPSSNGRFPKATPNKQIETRTQDGKRRITPIFLAPQFDVGEGPPQPFQSGTSEPTFSSSTEKSKIDVEKTNIVVNVTPKSRDKFSSAPKSSETKDKASPTTDKQVSSEVKVHIPAVGSDKPSTADKDKDKNKLSVKRKLDTPAAAAGDAPPKKKDGRGRPRKYPLPNQTPTSLPVTTPQVIREPAKIIYTNSGLDLPVPSIEGRLNIQISGTVGSDSALNLEMEPSSGKLQTLKCHRGTSLLWESVLTSKPIAIAGNSHVSCVACEDQSLMILSSSAGRRLFPTLVLDSKVTSLRCSGAFLMAITTKGSLFIWNVQTLSAVIKNESLVSIIPNSDTTMVSSLLTEQGLPVITLSNGKTYTFKTDLGTWVILSSRNDPLLQSSDLSALGRTDNVQGPLSTLQTRKQGTGSQASHLFRAPSAGQQAATVSHLENQVACCLALQSGKEYRHWLLAYVRYLVQEGLEFKLRDICDEFLGPVFKSKTSVWQPQVLGFNKRTLLKEMLPIIGTNLQLQRLFTEYQEQLDSVV